MVKNHISRLNAPKCWTLLRKETRWIARPLPGPHPLNRSVTLNMVLKDILGYAKTTREVKNILNKGLVKVDNKIRKDHKFPIGIMDVISIEETKEYFRVLINQKGKIVLIPIKKEEASLKPRKITNKTNLKKKKLQFNFLDGTNMLLKGKFDTNDTLLFDLSKNELKETLKLEKGVLVYIIAGKQIGKIGVVKEIEKKKDTQPAQIVFTKDKQELKTLKDYAFVIGKTKPIITMLEEK
ncbi:MAG: 30S ribosomal protein S4e [Nanoarchaeota archaeon]